MAGIVQDITERKLVEARLAEQAAMLANVNDAVIGYSVDNRVTYWNRAAETIYGYSAAEALGKVGTILLRATYTGVTRDELVEKIARVGSIETESGRTAKDGRQLQIESHVIALRDSSGKVTGYVAVDRDTTERVKIQRALRVSEERYRNLFSTMSEGFGLHEIILDDAGKPCDYRFLELNDAFERLTGFPVKTSIGKTAKELLPGLEPYWIENYGRVALTGEPARFENYSASLGKWFETFSFSPAKNQFAVLFSDITERKKIEEALKESEEKYRTIIELANEGIWTTDAERKTTFANQRMAEMLGYTVDELMDKSPSEFLDPDQEPDTSSHPGKAKSGNSNQQEFKFRTKRRFSPLGYFQRLVNTG